MDAAWRMLQLAEPQDLIIATGRRRSLKDFLGIAFEAVGLNYEDHVTSDARLLRPYDIQSSVGNPKKAREVLGWSAQRTLEAMNFWLEEHEYEAGEDRVPGTAPAKSVPGSGRLTRLAQRAVRALRDDGAPAL